MKKEYIKPIIETVELSTEACLLSGSKVMGTAGVNTGDLAKDYDFDMFDEEEDY